MIKHIFRVFGILLFFILSINYVLAISGEGTNLDVRIDQGTYSLSTNESTSTTSDFRAEGGDSPSSLGTSTTNFLRFGILNFSLDVPVFSTLTEKDQSNNAINSTAPIITGETLTLDANISSSNSITFVYVSFWRTTKGGSKVSENLLNLNSGLYSLTTLINYTYPFGPLNYTITVNNSLGASIDLDDVIEIEYNTTFDVKNSNNVSYGNNLTLFAAYNYTNSTAVPNAICNYTLSGLNRSLPFTNQLYMGSINSTELNLGSYNIYWDCGMSFHTNRSATSNFTVNDFNAPTISGITVSPSNVVRTSDVIVNATITDTFLQSVWIESDYTGGYINYTNLTRITKNGNVYTFTIGAFNLSSNQNVSYRWYANDTVNNIARGELHSFNVTNRLPGIPTLNNPQNNDYVIYDNTTLFSWNTSDLDRETLFYNLQIANTSSFANGDLVINTSLTFAGGNANSIGNYSFVPTSIPTGAYYWRVRVKDNSSEYTAFSSTRSFNLIYALINISAPFYDQIITTNTTTITVDEVLNGPWVNSVDLIITVDGVSSTVSAVNTSGNSNSTTSYNYLYTIPSGLNSTYISVTAVGRNGVNSMNATSRFRTTKTVGTIRGTSIDYLCASRTVNAPNSTTNLTLNINTGVLLNSVNVSLIYPNGTTVILSDYQNNSNLYTNRSYVNYSYEYNYSVAFGPVGIYTLNAEIRDVNYPTSNAVTNQRNLTVSPSVTLNLSTSGFNTFKILDTCSSDVLASGSSITSAMPEGKYNLFASTTGNKQVVELINANISSLGFQVCNFTELDETITVPSTFRALDQFGISCNNNILFDGVNLTYDYSSIISSIITENSLKIYKCDNLVNNTCTWNLVSTDLRLSGNNVTAMFTNFSTFMIGEDLSLVQVPSLPATVVSGGGGSNLNLGEDVVLLDLLQPGKVTLYNNESITTPVVITNNGNYTLEDITLSATSDDPKVTLSFDQSHIDSLSSGEERILQLTISSLLAGPGDRQIKVNALVNKPNVVNDNTLIFLDLIAHDENIVDVAEQQLEFLSKLFNENPECKDFEELANTARESFTVKDYRKSLQYTDAALQGCKNKIASEEKQIFSINKLLKLNAGNILLTSIEFIVLAFVAVMLYTYYKRRRIRKGKI